jgi:serine/threonine protein kinase
MVENLSALATKIDWASVSGVVLEGGYELKDVVEVREEAAKISARILGSGGRLGSAYFLHLEAREAEDQLDIWQTLRDAPHPNLSRPLAVGRRQIGGVETIYLVLADPDEKLATVIPERSLEWEEAAEVLHSLEKGLAHLHAYGLIHGSVSPQTVQAVGYTILLDTAEVRRLGTKPRVEWQRPQNLAPESKDFNTTTAADVWCLGATLFEVLAQEPYGSPGAELEKGLPLAAVIARCLEKDPITRCTLKDAPSIQEAPPQEPPTQAKLPEADPVIVESEITIETLHIDAMPLAPETPGNRVPITPGTTARSASASRLPQPLTPKAPPRQVTKEDMALVPIAKRHKKVQGKRQGVDARIRTLDGPIRSSAEESVYTASSTPAVAARILAVGSRSNGVQLLIGGLALVILFASLIWFIIIPKLQTPAQPTLVGESAQSAAEPRTGDPSVTVALPKDPEMTAPNPTPSLVASKPAEPPSSDPAPAPITRTARPQLFRVVLSTSDSQPEAIAKFKAMSQKYPDFLMQVTTGKDESGRNSYLIVAGGVLTRSEADVLRQRLASAGLQSAHIEELQR